MPNFPVLKTYIPVLSTSKRYIDIWGGRGRGGSFFITQMALMRLTHPSYFRGYFVRQAFRDIRDSLWRDLKDRISEMEEAGELNSSDFHLQENEMRCTYLPTGNTIISKGVQKDGQRTAKMKSLAGATHVFIEEANELNEADFNQLDDSLRTVKADSVQIYRCFNPPEKAHWIWRDYVLTDGDTDGYMTATCKNTEIMSVFSTYLDNLVNINESTARKWENYLLANPEHYYTVVRGLVSEGKRGRIYRGWKPITPAEFDAIDRPIIYGLDFGYSSDPNALVACKIYNDQRYYKEMIYEAGMDDTSLFNRIVQLGITNEPTVADTGGGGDLRIANLRRLSYENPLNIISAQKGPGSVNAGISMLQGKEVFVTSDSANIWNEYNSYCWAITRDKELTDTTVDKDNHTMDAIRYVELKHKAIW